MPKVTLTDLEAGYGLTTSYNANNDAIEAAFENTISRDGSTPNAMAAELDMNSNKIINVAQGVASGDAVNVSQLEGTVFSNLDVGSASVVHTYAALSAIPTPTDGDTAFVDGEGISGLFVYDSTLSATDNGGTIIDGWARRFSGPVSLRWFGTGGANYAPAIQWALDAGLPVYIPEGTWTITGTVELPNGAVIKGDSHQTSILSYTGAGIAVRSKTPGTRTYGWSLSGFTVTDAGTGTVGIEMDSVSLSMFTDVRVIGFDVQFDIHSPTSGFSVYNRFFHCLAQGATGYRLRGASSNAHVFVGCRTNLATVRGADIVDSNDNKFIACQFESGSAGTAVYITATAALADGNQFLGCRIETYATGIGYHIASANVRDTQIVFPLSFSSVGTQITDSGTRTAVWGANANTMGNKLSSALPYASGVPYRFERTTIGDTTAPCMQIADTSTAGGTPTTLEVTCERATGNALRVMRAATEQFSIMGDGKIRTNQGAANVATPSGATAYQLPIYNASGTLLGYVPVYAAAWT